MISNSKCSVFNKGVLWVTPVCKVAWCSGKAQDWQTVVVIPNTRLGQNRMRWLPWHLSPLPRWINVCHVPWKELVIEPKAKAWEIDEHSRVDESVSLDVGNCYFRSRSRYRYMLNAVLELSLPLLLLHFWKSFLVLFYWRKVYVEALNL